MPLTEFYDLHTTIKHLQEGKSTAMLVHGNVAAQRVTRSHAPLGRQ